MAQNRVVEVHQRVGRSGAGRIILKKFFGVSALYQALRFGVKWCIEHDGEIEFVEMIDR